MVVVGGGVASERVGEGENKSKCPREWDGRLQLSHVTRHIGSQSFLVEPRKLEEKREKGWKFLCLTSVLTLATCVGSFPSLLAFVIRKRRQPGLPALSALPLAPLSHHQATLWGITQGSFS